MAGFIGPNMFLGYQIPWSIMNQSGFDWAGMLEPAYMNGSNALFFDVCHP